MTVSNQTKFLEYNIIVINLDFIFLRFDINNEIEKVLLLEHKVLIKNKDCKPLI